MVELHNVIVVKRVLLLSDIELMNFLIKASSQQVRKDKYGTGWQKTDSLSSFLTTCSMKMKDSSMMGLEGRSE